MLSGFFVGEEKHCDLSEGGTQGCKKTNSGGGKISGGFFGKERKEM